MTGRLGPGLEFDLIRRFLEGASEPGPGVIIGPGDDCAVIEAPRVAVSVDLSIEGVHFRREWLHAEEIGYRATMASLSDLAAMAAAPIGVLASLAVTDADLTGYAEGVMDGVREGVEEFGGTLLGGDLVRTGGPLTLDIVALGSSSEPVLRSGARIGDQIWVTGLLGGAAAAVRAWLSGDEPDDDAQLAYTRPRPRIREATWLRERGAMTALLDISDGLAGDLRHIAAASGVTIEIEIEEVPIHPAATRQGDGLRLALHGGEDYELAIAMPPEVGEALVAEFFDRFGVRLTRVGEVIEGGAGVGQGMVVVRDNGNGDIEPLEGGGFEHFHSG